MFLGIDVASRDVATVLAQPDGTIVLALRAPLPTLADAPQTWKIALDTAQETLLRGGIEPSKVRAVACALEAKITADGIVERSERAEGWHGFDLARSLRESLRIPNASAASRAFCEFLGEERFGAWRTNFALDPRTTNTQKPDATTEKELQNFTSRANADITNGNVANGNVATKNAPQFVASGEETNAINTEFPARNFAERAVLAERAVENGDDEKSEFGFSSKKSRDETRLYLRVGTYLDAVIAVTAGAKSSTRNADFALPDGFWRQTDWGEICIERDGVLSGSGRRGTLEAYCGSENFLVRAAGYGLTLQSAPEIWAQTSNNFAARSLCDDYVRRLAQGVGSAISLWQPAHLLLGGALVDALGETLLQPLRAALPEFCATLFLAAPKQTVTPPQIQLAQTQLAHDGAVLGAVALAMRAAN